MLHRCHIILIVVSVVIYTDARRTEGPASKSLLSGGPCEYKYWIDGLCGVLALCPSHVLNIDAEIDHAKCPNDSTGNQMICCPKSEIPDANLPITVSRPIIYYSPHGVTSGIQGTTIPNEEEIYFRGDRTGVKQSGIYYLNETAARLKEEGFKVTVTAMYGDAIGNITYSNATFAESIWICSDCDDGVRQLVGGRKAPPAMLSFMALVGEKRDGTIRWVCDGVVINRNWIISAAHCFIVTSVTPNVVRLGDYDWARDNENETTGGTNIGGIKDFHETAISNIVYHPLFREPQRYYDIILVKLDQPYKIFASHINPIRLPWDVYTGLNIVGYKVTLTGWGATEYSPLNNQNKTGILQAVDLEVFDNEVCDQSYSRLPDYSFKWPRGLKNDAIVCAGWREGGRDACKGDSGAPLFWQREGYGTYFLAGIVSTGHGCGSSEFPGIYTNVNTPEMLNWIKETAFSDMIDSADPKYLEKLGNRCVWEPFASIGKCVDVNRELNKVNIIGDPFPWLSNFTAVDFDYTLG